MARKLSRRSLALHVATRLVNGVSQKEISQQLAAYLITTKRTKELSVIIRDIQYHLAQHGHISGTVTSARELSAATMKTIEAFAKETTGAAKVSLDRAIDESLIGGIKLNIPGHELDTTVARQINVLKTRYKKA